MIAEVQIAINELHIDDIKDAKYKMAKHINKITTNQRRTPKTKNSSEYKKKIKNNNIIHVEADEGDGLVLINKNEYINKTLEFIKENNFTEIKKKTHQ